MDYDVFDLLSVDIYGLNTAFEAFYLGSWHGVNFISIKNGHISIQLNYQGSLVEDTICSDYLRVRSRKARASDCLHILKTGVDVCVLSNHPITESSDVEPQEPVCYSLYYKFDLCLISSYLLEIFTTKHI